MKIKIKTTIAVY